MNNSDDAALFVNKIPDECSFSCSEESDEDEYTWSELDKTRLTSTELDQIRRISITLHLQALERTPMSKLLANKVRQMIQRYPEGLEAESTIKYMLLQACMGENITLCHIEDKAVVFTPVTEDQIAEEFEGDIWKDVSYGLKILDQKYLFGISRFPTENHCVFVMHINTPSSLAIIIKDTQIPDIFTSDEDLSAFVAEFYVLFYDVLFIKILKRGFLNEQPLL